MDKATGDERPAITGDPSSELRSLIGRNVSMKSLTASLTNIGLGNVIDKTGLTGAYNFELRFQREAGTLAKGAQVGVPIREGNGASLFTAIEEQLGLKLVLQKVPVEYFVIDSAERPTEN